MSEPQVTNYCKQCKLYSEEIQALRTQIHGMDMEMGRTDGMIGYARKEAARWRRKWRALNDELMKKNFEIRKLRELVEAQREQKRAQDDQVA